MAKTLAIVHYHPVERYPPALNMIAYLKEHSNLPILVITKKDFAQTGLRDFSGNSQKITIYRPLEIKSTLPGFRILNYLLFYIQSLGKLFLSRPSIILYYDTISSLPALIYKKLNSNNTKLRVHYHEYMARHEYRNGILKYLHRFERSMYARHFDWVSQTNEVRLSKFIQDENNNIPDQILEVLPNYPSKQWLTKKSPDFNALGKVKLVYVGALGYNTMYFEELLRWLDNNSERFTLDIYCYNMDSKIRQILYENNRPYLKFNGGCDYYDLPRVLSKYDVGLVMYRGFSENTINAVSNKVFEYLICGLDVWFSIDMVYTFKFIRQQECPKVIPVNFLELENFDYLDALNRDGLPYSAPAFFYEDIYQSFLKRDLE